MLMRLSIRLILAVLSVAYASGSAHAGASNSLMDVTPDGKRLLVANADNGSVTVIDTAANKALREIAVGGKPEGVAWIGNGPLAAVTVYHDDVVAFVDTESGRIVDKLRVADEPYGIVVTKDGSRAYVTHEYPGIVSEIDLRTRKVLREMKAGSMVRGLALSPDEKRLYVTEFYTGALIALDRNTGDIVDRWKGHSSDNLCRNVVVHPRRPKAYLSHIRSKIEVVDGSGSIFPQLSVCDLVPPSDKKRRTSFGMDSYNGVYVVTNPWEAALSPDGKRIYTIYAGTNDMNVSQIVDDDYKEIKRIGYAVRIGQNPRAVRVSPDGKKVYIANALDFDVSVHDAESMERLARIKVCQPPKSPEWVLGKILFSTANRPLTSRRWIACASCHPDGHSDGRVWQNPEGLRKTPAFMGLAHTHPLHWSADRDEVQDFEYTIRGRLMQGPGLLRGSMKRKIAFEPIELSENLAGRSKDLDAVAVYSNSFEFTLSPHIPAPGKLSAAAERGRKLFASDAVGCIKCHSGPYYTDSTLKKPFNLHDVGTGGDDSSEKMGPKYDTPTLLGVYRTAPYLHHGKAKTLRDVLTTCNPGDKHGKTSHLQPREIDDLVAFLKSLPFELPPKETPNTVKYRYRKDEGFHAPAATRSEQADAPVLVVAASYPGASAQVVADTVAALIENQINGIEGMVRIESTSYNDGRYTAHLYFKPKTDPKSAKKLVQRRVALAESALPDAVRRNKISVTIGKAEAGRRKVTIAVIDRRGHDRKELQNAAAAVVKRLTAKDALIDPQIFPGEEKHVTIDIDRAKCASLGVPIADVSEAVRAAGSAMKPERLKKVIVRDKITLGDVVAIKEGYGPAAVYSVNFFPAVRITGAPPEGQSVAEAAVKSVDLAKVELERLGSRGFAVENLSAK